MPLQLLRVKSAVAAEVAARCQLEEPALAALDPADTPGAFVEKLVAANLFHDAIRFLAAALPPRESVGWGCLCVRKIQPPEPGSPAKSLLDAAEQWVRAPGDETRRAAFEVVKTAGSDTPAGMLASAVFFSGGSIGPPNAEAVPPPEHAHSKLIAGVVFLLATPGDPAKVSERLHGCLDLGLGIAKGHPG